MNPPDDPIGSIAGLTLLRALIYLTQCTRVPCFLSLAFVNIQSVIVDCEYAPGMPAEMIIAALVSVDVILLVRAYRANVAYKPRARRRGRRFIAE